MQFFYANVHSVSFTLISQLQFFFWFLFFWHGTLEKKLLHAVVVLQIHPMWAVKIHVSKQVLPHGHHHNGFLVIKDKQMIECTLNTEF